MSRGKGGAFRVKVCLGAEDTGRWAGSFPRVLPSAFPGDPNEAEWLRDTREAKLGKSNPGRPQVYVSG